MKAVLFSAAIAASMLASGCTTSGWIYAAGDVMQAKDAYEKQERNDRIRRANAAAARVRNK